MHPQMTAGGDDQLAPAAGSAVTAALEATLLCDRAVGPTTINFRCSLHGSSTTLRLAAPMAITRGWHWPRVALQQAAGGIPCTRACWGEVLGSEVGTGLRWRHRCGHFERDRGRRGCVYACV